MKSAVCCVSPACWAGEKEISADGRCNLPGHCMLTLCRTEFQRVRCWWHMDGCFSAHTVPKPSGHQTLSSGWNLMEPLGAASEAWRTDFSSSGRSAAWSSCSAELSLDWLIDTCHTLRIAWETEVKIFNDFIFLHCCSWTHLQSSSDMISIWSCRAVHFVWNRKSPVSVGQYWLDQKRA